MWPCLHDLPIVRPGAPEISTDKCEPGKATNLYVSNGERRLRIQRVELPPNHPDAKASPAEKEKAWKEFFTKYPDWGAWEVDFAAKARALLSCAAAVSCGAVLLSSLRAARPPVLSCV